MTDVETRSGDSGMPFPEWLTTNALGSFAMGTPKRIPERKYHGLLMVRSPIFADPHHLLAEVNEVLLLPEGGVELGSFHYDGTLHPNGYEHLSRFEPGSEPKWHYKIGEIQVTRTLKLHPRRNAVLLTYRVDGAPQDTKFLAYPYFSCRRVHDLQRENAILDGRPTQTDPRICFKFYKGFPEIFLDGGGAEFELSGFWNQRVCYPEEARRGYPHAEDLFCPGAFSVALDSAASWKLTIGLVETGSGSPAWPKKAAAKKAKPSLLSRLDTAADAFLIEKDKDRASIIAGYPWFGEWGRDTFISLPGLTLARNKPKISAQILANYACQLKQGLVPNVLGRDSWESDGYAADASLWFIRAVQQLEFKAGETAAKPFLPVVFSLLDTFLKRKVRGIHVRPSGLLYASSHPRPLTWMDARVNGLPVTPRSPFAVDVNALFFNAIGYALRCAKREGDDDFVKLWEPLMSKLKETFREAFWLKDEGYLADSHDGLEPEPSFRPNQLLAIALPFPLLDRTMGASILKGVREKLLTPFGLRTLAPSDPQYHGRCEGDPTQRDNAYHQGTVWPWLLGMYWDAVRFVEGKAAANREGKRILKGFELHLDQACIGQISEIFDGDSPHTPRGAPAQAWSVAELLRIAHNFSDLDGPLPRRKAE